MQIHLKSQTIQIAATACLYNLTKQQLSHSIPLLFLNHVVDVVLKIMEYYPNVSQIQKNCLFILRNGKILKNCVRTTEYKKIKSKILIILIEI